jgi:tetratricopeptide (TPR) repeat protein
MDKMKHSEYQFLNALKRNDSLSSEEVYKACVSLANHGATLPEEANLSEEYKILLEVRRLISKNHLTESEEALQSYQSESFLLRGDREFLLGQIYHKRGIQVTASQFMYRAADLYRLIPDQHRELRARVNGAIMVSTLESALYGELFNFEQEVRRLGFMDILGNICRNRAMEFLVHERIQEAASQAQEAAACYNLDGYQDDRGVALYLAAICFLLMGDTTRAHEVRAQAFTSEGKTEIYKYIYETLLMGKIPKLPEGHTMALINWNKIALKHESVPGKIVLKLRQGPLSRDEIIKEVWGPEATDQTYCGRLYTAINYLRKERSIHIVFDGSFYKLA